MTTLNWTKAENNVRTADYQGVRFEIHPVSGGYFRLQVNDGWQGTRSSLTKLEAVAEQIASGSPVSPLTEQPEILTMPSAASKKDKKSAPKAKPAKAEKPKQDKKPNPEKTPEQPKPEVPAPAPAPAPAPVQEQPAEEPKSETPAPAPTPVQQPEPAKDEPKVEGLKFDCLLCQQIADQDPKLTKEQVVKQCQVCTPPGGPKKAKKTEPKPAAPADSPESSPSEGVSSGSPEEPQPEVRSSKGLQKIVAVAGKSPLPLPVNLASRSEMLKWCEGIRDHFQDQGKYVTVSGLCGLARSLASNVESGAALALMIQGIYDREVKAVEAHKQAQATESAQGEGDKKPKTPKGEKPAAQVLSSDENTKVTQGKGGGKRYELFGQPVTAVLRWMGLNGWKFADARKALDNLGIECADGTLVAQLRAGVKQDWAGRGEPAKVTDEQAKQLQDAAAKAGTDKKEGDAK